eukprot:scaffold4587_cov182-Amphora_coffeaeformis.AAC.9
MAAVTAGALARTCTLAFTASRVTLSPCLQERCFSISTQPLLHSRPFSIKKSALFSTASNKTADGANVEEERPPLYLAEGLFAVDKPANWTSQDVVAFIRGRLEQDARKRKAKPQKLSYKSKRNIKVGHGGTLDPLATGVLVIGVGRGTKQLQSYLKGSKRYTAGLELGYETNTLDLDGNVTKTAPFDHVTLEAMEAVVPDFTGTISQIPPIFSAIRKNGKRLHEQARKGVTSEDLDLEPRTVEIHELTFQNTDNFPPKLDVDVSCGSGTYIRSLVRDLGYAVNSVATTTSLRRTQQGPFSEADCLAQEDWSVENFYAAIERTTKRFDAESNTSH